MPSPVHVRVIRDFPVPRDEAYAWLTDIQDSDVERAGGVIEARKVVERTPTRIVYEGVTEVLGRRNPSTTEVTLAPPDRWEARVTQGPRLGSRTDYRLVSLPSGTRLTVDYHFVLQDPKRHVLLRLAKPLVAREMRKMWDGFAASMEKELRRG